MPFKPISSSVDEHSVEMQLLIAVAALRPTMRADQRQRVLDLLQQSIDWEKFLEFAYHLDVLILIAYNLNQYFRNELPPETQKRLENNLSAQAIQNMTSVRALVAILREFEQHDIAVLNFKGPSLLARCYDHIMQRHYSDLDFIIHPAQYDLAVERLKSLGYRLVTENSDSFWNRNVYDARKGYHQAFTHPDVAFLVEIHWRITNEGYSMVLPEALMWSNVQTVSWGKVGIKTFSDELLLLLLSAHGAKHKWDALKWVCDIGFLLQDQRGLDWVKYLDLARRFRCLRRALLSIVLACSLFDLPLPPALVPEIEREPEVKRLCDLVCLWLLAEGNEGVLPEKLGFMADIYDTPWQRFQQRLDIFPILIGRLLQPSERDREIIQLPNALSFLYILIRPLRLLLQRLGLLKRRTVQS